MEHCVQCVDRCRGDIRIRPVADSSGRDSHACWEIRICRIGLYAGISFAHGRRPGSGCVPKGRGTRVAGAGDSRLLRTDDASQIGIAAIARHRHFNAPSRKSRRISRAGGGRCVRIRRAVYRRGDGLGGDGGAAGRSNAAGAAAGLAGRFARAVETNALPTHRPATALVPDAAAYDASSGSADRGHCRGKRDAGDCKVDRRASVSAAAQGEFQ